ncbi:alpha-L-fucosidase [Prolixibacteraceae bacterium Z1-6]|uniref:alpha-L-fucosidase n=1 Tax=Draconibacterium aestuarii TaxID=2998507 RepID=A0A9X3FAJ8_9BACT|nr:alpha-L-fucosidase [Prolixibacteraceae bacterium Z1-6]
MLKTGKLFVLILAVMTSLTGCEKNVDPPKPYGAIPSERQMAWHEMETYAFIHFTTNTFTDLEWGYGDESTEIFNPTDFNADQIIGTLAKAGFKGAIITAKHHDGFCLWPTEYTEHSVKNSPWKDGKGDVVREISDACKRHGIKFGVYLSPWDRNHAEYGNEKYISYYQDQLKELLTNYGDVFEIWFDGANGGDGYYGGSKESRKIDRSSYYQWEKVWETVRELQPNANIFSDAGPDLRWIGNEHGHAKDSCWATYTPEARDGESKAYAGTTKYWVGEYGTENGKFWIPAETDVSIRPGWFYHASEDDKVKTLEHLLDIYFASVGNGTSLNLNVPPDRTGQIHETDSVRLMEFKAYLDKAFANNLFKGCKVKASYSRGTAYSAKNLVDNNVDSYWATGDEQKSASIEFKLDRNTEINCIVLQEYIQLGQRITDFTVEVWENNQWKEVADGSTIGYKKIVRFDSTTTNAVKVNIKNALACPVLSKVAAFTIPEMNE